MRTVLEDFLVDCLESVAHDQAARLRQAVTVFQLVCDAPTGPVEQHIERMLSDGAYESAALAILGPQPGFLLSRGANGRFLASVVLPGESEEATAEGSTLALALVAAYASALLAQQDAPRGVARSGGDGHE